MKNLKIKLLTGLIAFSCITSANAATATAPMQITATVDAKCNLTASNMNFANAQPGSMTTTISGSTTFGVECTKDTSYILSFNMGLYSSGIGGTRRLKHTSKTEYLNYSMRVGATTIDDMNILAGTGQGFGTVNTQTINGDLTLPGNASTGSYSDTVTVTITY